MESDNEFPNPFSATEIGVDAEIALPFFSSLRELGGTDNSFLQEPSIPMAAIKARTSWIDLMFVFFMVWILDL